MMNNRIDKDNNNNIDTSESNLPDDNEVRLSCPIQFNLPLLKLKPSIYCHCFPVSFQLSRLLLRTQPYN